MAIDQNAVAAEIRFLTGGLPTSVMDDTLLLSIIQRSVTKYGDLDANLCIITYQSLLAALQYLDRKAQQGSAATGATGALKKRSEKIAGREIDVEYETGGTAATAAGYGELYKSYLQNPQWVCESLKLAASSTVIIGGVSQTEYDRVKNNTDSRNGMSMVPKCGSRTSRRGY